MFELTPDSGGSERHTTRNFWRWLAGGLAGGFLGVIPWVIVTFTSGLEVLAIALAIGVLAGLGVQASARRGRGLGPGVAAVLAGLISMGAAKAGHFAASFPRDRTENALVTLEGVIGREYEREGRPVHVRSFGWQTMYPEEIRAEAERRWNSLSPEERIWYRAGVGHAKLLDREWVILRWLEGARETACESSHDPNAIVEPFRLVASEDYPAEVWQQAVARWEGLTPRERRSFEQNLAEEVVWELVLFHVFSVLGCSDLIFFPAAAVAAFLVGFGWPVPKGRRVAVGSGVVALVLLAVTAGIDLVIGARIREESLKTAEPTVAGSSPTLYQHSTDRFSFRAPIEWKLEKRSESSAGAEIMLRLDERNLIGVGIDARRLDPQARIAALAPYVGDSPENCEDDWEFFTWDDFGGAGKVLRCSLAGEPVQLKQFVSEIEPLEYLEVYALYVPDQETRLLEAEYQVQKSLDL